MYRLYPESNQKPINTDDLRIILSRYTVIYNRARCDFADDTVITAYRCNTSTLPRENQGLYSPTFLIFSPIYKGYLFCFFR